MLESGRIAMDRMERETRDIKNRTYVYNATSSFFRFMDRENRIIGFDRSGTVLRRSVNGTVNNLSDYVSGLSFTYYNDSGAVIASPTVNPQNTTIRSVEINLNLTSGTSLSFRSRVSPRKLQ
jgi:hypothetical protein